MHTGPPIDASVTCLSSGAGPSPASPEGEPEADKGEPPGREAIRSTGAAALSGGGLDVEGHQGLTRPAGAVLHLDLDDLGAGPKGPLDAGRPSALVIPGPVVVEIPPEGQLLGTVLGVRRAGGVESHRPPLNRRVRGTDHHVRSVIGRWVLTETRPERRQPPETPRVIWDLTGLGVEGRGLAETLGDLIR